MAEIEKRRAIEVRYNKEDIESVLKKVFREVQIARESGQKEYAHDNSRPFRNFEQIASEISIPRTKAWFVLAKKHWDGITAYINGYKSQREDIRGRINDEIMYLIILRAMIDEQDGIPISVITNGNDSPAG